MLGLATGLAGLFHGLLPGGDAGLGHRTLCVAPALGGCVLAGNIVRNWVRIDRDLAGLRCPFPTYGMCALVFVGMRELFNCAKRKTMHTC